MPLQFDATLKDLGRHDPPGFLARFDRPADGPVALLNVDLSTVTAAADLFFGIGQPLREVVHLDVQSGPSPTLDRRVRMYNALGHAQLGVPIHSIVVLLHPRADHPNITGAVRYASRPERGHTDFAYEVVRLWQQPVEAFLTGPLATVPLAPLCQLSQHLSEEEALRLVVERVLERLQQEAPPERVRQLLTAAYILTGLRTNPEVARGLFQGVRAMRESSTYQAILDEGRIEGKQTTLLRQGCKRFGEPDEATRQRLLAVTSVERLDALSERLLDVGSWQELLAPP
jgi:hypothetical protein